MIIEKAELRRRYLQRAAGVRDNKAYIGPETVALELTNACNLRCHYCRDGHSPANPAHLGKKYFFSWERFPEIVRDCVDLKVDQLVLTGTGEPSMHPSFRDMMRYLERHPLKVVLTTNATFPPAYCSDVIKGDQVIINLSAVDRQQYLDLKGKDLFDRVVANIKRLVDLRGGHKPGFRIEIDYILNTANIGQKQKMQEMASRLGIDAVNFKKMITHDYNRDIAVPEGDLMSYGEGEDEPFPLAFLNGWFNVMVASDGHFNNCYRVPQRISGDLDKWSLKEFWHSSQMMKMRLLGKRGHIQGVNRPLSRERS